jgi:hypothetical protein
MTLTLAVSQAELIVEILTEAYYANGTPFPSDVHEMRIGDIIGQIEEQLAAFKESQ